MCLHCSSGAGRWQRELICTAIVLVRIMSGVKALADFQPYLP